jgi:hypothetical protein
VITALLTTSDEITTFIMCIEMKYDGGEIIGIAALIDMHTNVITLLQAVGLTATRTKRVTAENLFVKGHHLCAHDYMADLFRMRMQCHGLSTSL